MKKEFIKKMAKLFQELDKSEGTQSVLVINEIDLEVDKYTRNHDTKQRLTNQLFIGKVTEEIGFDKTMKLLKETKQAIDKL